jgi:hypothetical protein
MSARWNRLGVVAPVLMGAALALGGCVDNDISLSIDNFIGPDTAMAATNICEFDASSVGISRGVYDAFLGEKINTGYSADFSVTNNLEMVTTEDVETQAYYITSFDVEIVPQGAADAGAHMAIAPMARKFSYSVATQRLAPGDSAFFSVQAIPASDAKAFVGTGGGSIEVRVRPVATRAEEEQHGAYSTFPVDICVGCLTGSTTYPKCSTLAGQTPLIGNVCNYAQDEPVTCCTDNGGGTVCGNNVTLAATM